MQRYSTENEKMVQQREKSIAALKQQLEDTMKAKVNQINILYRKKLKVAEAINFILNDFWINCNFHASHAVYLWVLQEASESKLAEYQKQLEQARSEVTEKSEEIKELLKAVECMQSKV